MRGYGFQDYAARVYVVGYYFLMLPFGCALSFPCKFGVEGMWLSLGAGTGFVLFAFSIKLRRLHFLEAVGACDARLGREIPASSTPPPHFCPAQIPPDSLREVARPGSEPWLST